MLAQYAMKQRMHSLQAAPYDFSIGLLIIICSHYTQKLEFFKHC